MENVTASNGNSNPESLFKFQPFKFDCIVDIKIQNENGLISETPAPLARSGHRMVCVDHKLFLYGGYNPNAPLGYCCHIWRDSKPLFAETWEFNTTSRKWRQHFEYPDCRNHGRVSYGCAVSGSIFFHIGGTGIPFGSSSSNSMTMCDTRTGLWSTLETTGEKPETCYGQAVCLENNDLYVVGGTSGFNYNLDVHFINIIEREWVCLYKDPRVTSEVEEFMLPRYRHEIIFHENKLLMFAGAQKEIIIPLTYVTAFCLTSKKFQKLLTHGDYQHGWPKQRKSHALVKYGEYVYVHGGTSNVFDIGDLWRLKLSDFRWECVKSGVTQPLYFHAFTVTTDGCFYLHGGVTGSESEATRSGKLLRCWLRIPSLKKMCWEAVHHYWPNILEGKTPLSLYQMGFPTLNIRECEIDPPKTTITFSPEDNLYNDSS